MRRVVWGLLALAALYAALGWISPAGACHFGTPPVPGGVCNDPPEEQPFDPQLSVTVADNRTSAHANTEVKVTQNADHQQFPVKLVIDFPPEAGIDLDIPAFQEKIADLNIQATLSGAATTLTGRIKDHNDPAHGHPSGGVYHWLGEVDSPTPGMPPTEVDIFVDKNAADGHLHLEFIASAELIANAQAVDASLRELKTAFFGSVAAGPFLTNPAAAGTYTVTAQLTGWDDPLTPETSPTVTRTASVTIVNRVPNSVSLSPTSNTLRVNNPQSFIVTVLDQGNPQGQNKEPLEGASVTFSVSGPNSATPPPGGTTDADGKVTSSYTGQNGGTDNVTATATKFGTSKTSNTATINWKEPKTLTMSPASASLHTGTSHTVTATVKDQNGSAMAGETVSFTRTGANPGSASGTTNSSGQTSHTYTGVNAGDDTITGTVQVTATKTLSGSATAHWDQAATISLSPSSASRSVGQTHTVTATVTDNQGNLQKGTTVSFSVSGANTASGSGTTDASGAAAFSYAGSNAGDDTITATADGATATATVHWTIGCTPTSQDQDGDCIVNTSDNCPNAANPDQADNDGDHFGNVCDNDDDNDSLQDAEEGPNNCDPFVKDTDGDGLNDWQEVKGYGLPCNDPDADDDGASDGKEKLEMATDPKDPDTDDDGVKDGVDNCPRISNPDQKDSKPSTPQGDACEPGVHICVNNICTG